MIAKSIFFLILSLDFSASWAVSNPSIEAIDNECVNNDLFDSTSEYGTSVCDEGNKKT